MANFDKLKTITKVMEATQNSLKRCLLRIPYEFELLKCERLYRVEVENLEKIIELLCSLEDLYYKYFGDLNNNILENDAVRKVISDKGLSEDTTFETIFDEHEEYLVDTIRSIHNKVNNEIFVEIVNLLKLPEDDKEWKKEQLEIIDNVSLCPYRELKEENIIFYYEVDSDGIRVMTCDLENEDKFCDI
jgi:hypothetical protein